MQLTSVEKIFRKGFNVHGKIKLNKPGTQNPKTVLGLKPSQQWVDFALKEFRKVPQTQLLLMRESALCPSSSKLS